MVSVRATNAEGHWIDHWLSQTKGIKLVFAAFLLSTQNLGVRAKTGQPRVRIVCLGKVAFLLRAVAFMS